MVLKTVKNEAKHVVMSNMGVDLAVSKTGNHLDMIKQPIYVATMLILHVSYILVFFGVHAINPIYINILNAFVQAFVGIFLVIRFFPFRKYVLRDFDGHIIFGAGTFLLTNLIFTEGKTYYEQYKSSILSLLNERDL